MCPYTVSPNKTIHQAQEGLSEPKKTTYIEARSITIHFLIHVAEWLS